MLFGVYWKGASKEGAIAAVIVGLVVTVFAQLKFGTTPVHPAAYAVPSSVLAMVVVSKFTRPLSREFWGPFIPQNTSSDVKGEAK